MVVALRAACRGRADLVLENMALRQQSAHGGPEYERLVDPRRERSEYRSEGLILQLHHWDVHHDHLPIVSLRGRHATISSRPASGT